MVERGAKAEREPKENGSRKAHLQVFTRWPTRAQVPSAVLRGTPDAIRKRGAV